MVRFIANLQKKINGRLTHKSWQTDRKTEISIVLVILKKISHSVDQSMECINKHLTYFVTVFENPRKSLIRQCERSELRLHFEWTKVNSKNARNGPFWRVFENLKLAVKQCYQTGQV